MSANCPDCEMRRLTAGSSAARVKEIKAERDAALSRAESAERERDEARYILGGIQDVIEGRDPSDFAESFSLVSGVRDLAFALADAERRVEAAERERDEARAERIQALEKAAGRERQLSEAWRRHDAERALSDRLAEALREVERIGRSDVAPPLRVDRLVRLARAALAAHGEARR